MTYASEISSLRAEVGDTPRRSYTEFTGDGIATVFQMPDDAFPVLESSYEVKVAGIVQVETTQFTLDVETGTIDFVSAPGSNVSVTITCKSVHLTDAGWITIINNTIRSFGDDYWKEFIDDTTFKTAANALSLSLVTGQPNCIAIYEFQWRQNTISNWLPVEEIVNWRYDRENNVIYLGNRDAFTVTNELFRVRGLKTYTLGTVKTDTLDLQDKYLTVLEYGAIARYWKWRYKSVVELVSKMTQENTRTPLQELIMLSDRFDRLYEIEKGKLKPQKPPRIIPPYKNNGGRP